MAPDAIAEAALIEVSRLQREAAARFGLLLPEAQKDHSAMPVNVRRLPDAIGNRDQHFANLNAWKPSGDARSALGSFWEVDRAIYEEFLNLLPPSYCAGGFRMIERLTDDIAATFQEAGGRYWCSFTNLSNDAEGFSPSHAWTFISAEKLAGR